MTDLKDATIQELVDELDIREGIGYEVHHAGDLWFSVWKDRKVKPLRDVETLLEKLQWIRENLNVGAWDIKPDDIMTALNQAIKRLERLK